LLAIYQASHKFVADKILSKSQVIKSAGKWKMSNSQRFSFPENLFIRYDEKTREREKERKSEERGYGLNLVEKRK